MWSGTFRPCCMCSFWTDLQFQMHIVLLEKKNPWIHSARHLIKTYMFAWKHKWSLFDICDDDWQLILVYVPIRKISQSIRWILLNIRDNVYIPLHQIPKIIMLIVGALLPLRFIAGSYVGLYWWTVSVTDQLFYDRTKQKPM